jgi:hypothetical protein
MIARALIATLAVNSRAPRHARRRNRRRRLSWRAAPAIPLLIAAVMTGTARADVPAPGDRPDYVPGELIVKFKPGVSAAERADAVADRDARLKRSLDVPQTALARVPGGADLDRTIRAVERDPRVAYAEPNPGFGPFSIKGGESMDFSLVPVFGLTQ